MNKELAEKLYKAAPNLYRDTTKGPHQSCMAFGIETGNGWFDLLMEASVKLEKEIEAVIEKHPITPTSKCYTCGCTKEQHEEDSKCNTIHYLPYHFGGFAGGYLSFCWYNIKNHYKTWYGIKYLWKQMILRRIKVRFYRKVNQISNWLHDHLNIGYHKPCFCKQFDPGYPRASQVKEKFGTLRLYVSSWTDEMADVIREAEKKSEVTCEHCGQPGTLRTDGWYFTFCDTCEKVRQEKGHAPWLP